MSWRVGQEHPLRKGNIKHLLEKARTKVRNLLIVLVLAFKRIVKYVLCSVIGKKRKFH